jgi:hypothetical protein
MYRFRFFLRSFSFFVFLFMITNWRSASSASTEGGAAGDATRGKKRKSDEIEKGEKNEEPEGHGGEKEAEEEKKRE